MLEIVLAQAPIAEVRYAQEMGATQAEFQCESFRRGLYTAEEMAEFAIQENKYRLHQAMKTWQWYSETGNRALMAVYINSLSDYSLSNCPKEFNYYLSR